MLAVLEIYLLIRSSRRMPGSRSFGGVSGWISSEFEEPASKPFHLGPGIRRDERLK